LFGKKEEGNVPLNSDVMMKCLCGMCPVQTESACAKPKIEKMMEMRASMSQPKSGTSSGMSMSMAPEPMGAMEPKPEDMPGPYCSLGVAACKDLNSNKACICRTCQVYSEYNLNQARPVEHYCFNSKAV
jgi:hypothetical protein